MTVTTRAVAALVAVVWSLSAVGCGSTTDGKPVEATSTPTADPDEPAGLFDPCTEISDDLLRQMGVDPATEEADLAGVEYPGWKVCSWSGPWYFLTVFVGDKSLDQMRENKSFTKFRDIKIGTRDALQYQSTSSMQDEDCFIGYAVNGGVVMIEVATMFSEEKAEDPCDVVIRDAIALNSVLPN
ncbi:DUF3558 domain-containing protein [Antrihabitans sp. YC3-6]|uniref:DUF3558 domain-containing protein n=1 Tax=Antrihabitans stalagmiti TaxID=2799499 RepID=A0A934NVZ8_9NOCA|nr:DUF3558 domain-containing protein [Antrihabitans stalagmiti]MBJ8342310.1 DUF3558 domain-containing protein [Antrihabitans stalagmiti]